MLMYYVCMYTFQRMHIPQIILNFVASFLSLKDLEFCLILKSKNDSTDTCTMGNIPRDEGVKILQGSGDKSSETEGGDQNLVSPGPADVSRLREDSVADEEVVDSSITEKAPSRESDFVPTSQSHDIAFQQEQSDDFVSPVPRLRKPKIVTLWQVRIRAIFFYIYDILKYSEST